MNQPTTDMHRLAELLADDALGALDAPDAPELESLSRRFPGHRIEEFDAAASLLQVALLEAHAAPRREPMPQALRDRVEATIRNAARASTQAQPTEHRPRTVLEPATVAAALPARPAGLLAWLGWAVAAASLFLAAAAWINRPVIVTTPGPMQPSADQRLAALIEAAPPDLLRIDWVAPSEDAAAAGFRRGEVVWSDRRNEGYMVFEGLAKNDPRVEQYQLWIFDTARSEAHPVDGGVFDIADGSRRVVIPIDPRVPVTQAALFAVTVEPPGGVVVSSRQRLPLAAPVNGG